MNHVGIEPHTPKALIADGKTRVRQMWASGTAEPDDIKALLAVFEALESILVRPKKRSWADAWGLFDARATKK